MFPPKDFTAVFLRKKQLTLDVYAFYFDRKNTDFDFIAGQYIRVILPHENPDNRGTSRLFSSAGSPLEKDHFFITTRIGTSTFKKALVELQPGTTISFWGPTGRFVLNEEETTPCLFLAGGIGITPFHSLLTYANQKKLQIPITFFVSFSTAEEVVFYNELRKIGHENPLIKIVYTVTHPEESKKKWDGQIGRISKELISKYIQNPQNARVYMAGPILMVQAMQQMVIEMGIPPEKILKENFVGY